MAVAEIRAGFNARKDGFFANYPQDYRSFTRARLLKPASSLVAFVAPNKVPKV